MEMTHLGFRTNWQLVVVSIAIFIANSFTARVLPRVRNMSNMAASREVRSSYRGTNCKLKL